MLNRGEGGGSMRRVPRGRRVAVSLLVRRGCQLEVAEYFVILHLLDDLVVGIDARRVRRYRVGALDGRAARCEPFHRSRRLSGWCS